MTYNKILTYKEVASDAGFHMECSQSPSYLQQVFFSLFPTPDLRYKEMKVLRLAFLVVLLHGLGQISLGKMPCVLQKFVS